MIADVIGTIIGCLIAGFVIYNVIKFILFKFIKEKTVYLYSFILSCILIVSIYTFLNGFVLFNLNYIAALLFLFIIDLIRFKKREKVSDSTHTDSLHINS